MKDRHPGNSDARMKETSYDLLRLGERHWWLSGRNAVIEAFLDRHLNERGRLAVLDIGSGYGATIPVLTHRGRVEAIEPYEPAYQSLRQAGVAAIHGCSDFPYSYPASRYDLVTLFDVLEHLSDDHLALRIVREKLLTAQGACVLTVPAYQWLWSVQDTDAGHFRRYTAGRLRKVMSDAGFSRVQLSYCMTFLFPLALIQKIRMKCGTSLESVFSMPHPFVNTLFRSVFSAERYFIPFVRLPYGLSIIAIGRK